MIFPARLMFKQKDLSITIRQTRISLKKVMVLFHSVQYFKMINENNLCSPIVLHDIFRKALSLTYHILIFKTYEYICSTQVASLAAVPMKHHFRRIYRDFNGRYDRYR